MVLCVKLDSYHLSGTYNLDVARSVGQSRIVVLCVKLDSYHLSGTYNLDVATKLLENSWTSGIPKLGLVLVTIYNFRCTSGVCYRYTVAVWQLYSIYVTLPSSSVFSSPTIYSAYNFFAAVRPNSSPLPAGMFLLIQITGKHRIWH